MKRSNHHQLIACLITFFLFGIEARAQSTQTVRGRIVDEVDNTPLIGVNIIVVSATDAQLGSTTDVDGNYRIENVPVGRQTIKVTYVGYEEQSLANIVVTAGKEVVLNFGLREGVSQLSEVVIVADPKAG